MQLKSRLHVEAVGRRRRGPGRTDPCRRAVRLALLVIAGFGIFRLPGRNKQVLAQAHARSASWVMTSTADRSASRAAENRSTIAR